MLPVILFGLGIGLVVGGIFALLLPLFVKRGVKKNRAVVMGIAAIVLGVIFILMMVRE